MRTRHPATRLLNLVNLFVVFAMTFGSPVSALAGRAEPPSFVPGTEATGDFSLDFVAAAPYSYTHATGGGAYDDRTVGKNFDIVESLEGGDFQCGDLVTLFTQIVVDDTTQAGADSPQTIEIDYEFLMDTTGQSGVAIGDIVYVGINYGTIEDLIPGENTVDDGISDDGGSVATLTSETTTGPMFVPGSKLRGTVQVTDLDRAEHVIVRVDVRLYCQPRSNPTGNLQADITGGRLTYVQGSVPVTPPGNLSVGNQTIPFRQFGEILFPEIDIQKSPDSQTVVYGQTATWTIVVTNMGNVPLTNVTVTDPLAPNCDTTIASLPVGGVHTYTCSLANVLAGFTNVATATVTYGAYTLEDSDDAVVLVDILPDISVTKTANPASVPETGGYVEFTFVVTNNSSESFTLSSLTDNVFGDLNGQGTCSVPQTIAALGTYSCAVTKFLASDTLTAHTNVVTASGTDPQGHPDSATDDETVTFIDELPAVDLAKDVTPATLPEPGGDFHFTLTITNNSVENVTITALTDDNPLPAACTDLIGDVLTPGQSVNCTYDISHADAGSYANTASVSVQDNDGNTASDTDSETVTVTDVMPVVDLVKGVTPASLAEPGGAFHFTLTITNNSVENVTITALTDDNPLPAACTDLIDDVLTPGQSVSCTYDVTHVEAGSYENTASVTVADNEGNTAGDSDTETVTVTDVLPVVDLVKDVTPATLAEPGGAFHFTLSITNNSIEDVTITALTDDNPLPAGCTDLIGDVLTPGQSVSCTYDVTHTEAGTYPNTASVTVADNEGNPASDTDSESVTVTDELPLVDLTKEASPASLPEPGGIFHFVLTITNNSVEDVSITALTDDNPLPAACTGLIGTVLTPGQSVDCGYDVTHTEAGIYPNTASVTVADNEGNTVGDSDSETVTVVDGMPAVDLTKDVSPATLPEPGGIFHYILTITNGSVEDVTITALTDDNPLPAACTDLIGDVLTPGQSVTCEYDVTHTEAGTYPNTASVTVQDNEGNTANDSDSETVTVTDVLPVVDLTKDVTPQSLDEPGGAFLFTLTITNNSVENVTITALTDDNPLPAGCTDLIGDVLTPGQIVSCTYNVTHTEAGTYPNTASVTVADNEGNPASDSDSETVTVNDVLPVVDLVKDVTPATLPEPGGAFNYTLTITNNSVENVSITALTDSNPLPAACTDLIDDVLTPGQTVSCTYVVTHTEAGSYPNTASVTVQDNEGNPASDSDSETVTVTDELPAVDLVKDVTPASRPEPGGAFEFTLTITNNSVENVTINALTDDNALPTACTDLIGDLLTPGQSVSCTYSVTHTDAGSYPNNASVTVADNEGNTASDTDNETVIVTDVMPAVDLVKGVTPASLAEPGGAFHFTLSITNNSVESVTINALTDSNLLPAECTDLIGDVLTPGQTVSCTYDVTHTEAGSYDNTASVTVADNEGNTASDSDSQTVTVTDVLPVVDLAKDVTPATLAEPGGAFHFTLTITNNSVENVTITTLTDDNLLPAECTDLIGDVLVPGQSVSCTYDVTHTEAGPYSNTASVTVQDNENNQASDTDTETVTVTDVLPVVDLVKDVTPASLAEPGGAFHFTLTITNNSVENVTITALTDDNPLPAACTDLIGDVLTPGQSVNCTYDVTHTEAGTYPNTASVTVEDNESNPASDTDSETVTVTDELPAVDLDKSVDPATLAEPGGIFHFTLTITNNSVENVTITALTDSTPLPAECTGLIGTTLIPGQSVSCTYDVTHTEAGNYDNTASVTVADDEGNTASDADTETVTVTDALPVVDLAKDVTPGTLPEPGGVFHFILTITNNSVENVTITALTDSNPLPAACTDLIGDVLTPGQSVTCEYDVTHTDAGTYGNTASVTVEDNEGNPASDTDTETVTVTDEVPVVDLTKGADPASLAEPGGVFQFTLTIVNNSVEAVTITGLTDTNALSPECQALIGTTLAAGASVSCTYNVTHTEAGTYDNTATVTVADNEGNAASDTDTETVTVTDAMPVVDLAKDVTPASLDEPGGAFHFTLTITNNSVENVTITALTDDNPLPAACTDLIGDVLTPGQSVSCTYDVTHTEAGSYNNTASVTVQDNENNQASDSDTETVTVNDVLPVVDLAKSVTPASLAEPGGVFQFTLTITNNSVENVTISGLIDDNPLPAACTDLIGDVLTPGQSVSCTYDVTHTEAGSYENSATVTVEDNEGNEASDTDTETVTVTDVLPLVDLAKDVTPAWLLQPGGNFHFTLTITNNSVESITISALTDTNALSADCLALIGTTLAAGASVSCTYDVTHTAPGSYPNTATVTAQDNEGNTDSDSDTETVQVLATTSKITPTGTTCQMFRDGTAQDYTEALYNVTKGKIGGVAPGVVFFWSAVTAPADSFSLESHQFNDSGALAWHDMGNLDVFLWDAACNKVQTVTLTTAGDGHPVLDVTGATAGAIYYFSVKYDVGSLSGISVVRPYPTVNYTFQTLLNGSLIQTSPDSLAVKPKRP